MRKTACRWISLEVIESVWGGGYSLIVCCLLNRRCSNKSCAAYKRIIIALCLFNIETARAESECGATLLSPSENIFFLYCYFVWAKHPFNIQVDSSLGAAVALGSGQQMFCLRLNPGTQRHRANPVLKKNGLEPLYNEDNNQGRRGIRRLRSIHHIK